MDFYLRLTTTSEVRHKDVNLPVHEQRVKGKLVYEPELEKCRSIVE
jgi:hypothetical protein